MAGTRELPPPLALLGGVLALTGVALSRYRGRTARESRVAAGGVPGPGGDRGPR